MLIAEIHGKRLPAAEEQEDWLTSAAFGHLRLIPPSVFWEAFLDRAVNVANEQSSVRTALMSQGVEIASYSKLEIRFWPNFADYGDPDLLVRFSGTGTRPLTLIIEVKLNSVKSGVGENDQLVRYMRLLSDTTAMGDWSSDRDLSFRLVPHSLICT